MYKDNRRAVEHIAKLQEFIILNMFGGVFGQNAKSKRVKMSLSL